MAREKTPEITDSSAVDFKFGLMSADLAWIKSSLEELKRREYTCYKERELESLATWRKGLSAILAAVLMTLLGSISMSLVTCSQQSEARGALQTQVENHSSRIIVVEQSLRTLEKTQQESTTQILSAIRERRD